MHHYFHKGIDFMQHYCGWTHSERLKACGRCYEVSLNSLESATDFLPMSFTLHLVLRLCETRKALTRDLDTASSTGWQWVPI